MVTMNYGPIIYSNDFEFVSYKILTFAPTTTSAMENVIKWLCELLFQIVYYSHPQTRRM